MSKKKKRYIEVQEEEQENNARSAAKEKKDVRYKKNVIVSAQTAGQKKYIIEIKNNDITFCYGPAGSGKTAVAVGIALQHICVAEPAYEKLVIMRPAKEACDEKIGFLPGDLDDKMSPWAAPVMDNMLVFIDQKQIKNLMWERRIEIIPTAYARGRSLNNSFIIVDEAQNLSPKQMLMILTRLGKKSKLVINGDLAQSDIRGDSGLFDAVERLQGIKGISFVEMHNDDIVRHPLIAKILNRYSDDPEPEATQEDEGPPSIEVVDEPPAPQA